jgi:hypothetical protein
MMRAYVLIIRDYDVSTPDYVVIIDAYDVSARDYDLTSRGCRVMTRGEGVMFADQVIYSSPNLLARKTRMKASARNVASQGCLPIGHLPCSLINLSARESPPVNRIINRARARLPRARGL